MLLEAPYKNISDNNNQLYKYTHALFNNEENPKIELKNWATFFSAEDVEEIVGLYLQVKEKLYVYTSTNKKSTDKIEFALVDDKGKKYGVQVKTGDVEIHGKDYKSISEDMIIFLFATSNKVYIENNENLIHIDVEKITEFIKNNKALLPERITGG